MATEAQKTANKENAQHSTGPTTESGKASSSQNHTRHGLTGLFRLLPFENPTEYDILLLSLKADHQPSNPTESILVERMAQHQWLIQRAINLQTLTFTESRDNEEHQKSLALYLRYQTTNERAFSKCLHDLLKLRADKRKEQIGFESLKLKEADLVRKQSIETRKQEMHKNYVWLAEAKAEHQELLNARLETPETRQPNRMDRVRARQQAA